MLKFPNGITLIKKGSKVDCWLTNKLSSSQFTYQQILGMLFPLILDQFFIFFIGSLTNALISTSGEDSMAAVALVSPITMIAYSLFTAVSSGGTVIVAQYKGKGDEKLVKRAAGQVVLLTFIVATVSAVLLIVFATPLINLIFADATVGVKKKAVQFMIGFAISLPAFSIFNGIFSVLRGVGDTKTCLRLTIIINAIHLAACYLFINLMRLDILGTALAFNVARGIGCIIAIMIIFSPKAIMTLTLKDIFRFDSKIDIPIVKMGVPFAIEQIFFNLGRMLCQTYMVTLGTAAIAADAISASVSNLFYGAGFGVTTLAITVIGQCIGAGDIELTKKYSKRMIQLGTIVMTLSVLILYPLSPLLLNLFNPTAEALPLIHTAILIGVIPIPFFWSMSFVMPSTLRAVGDANFTSIICLMTMWIFRVGLGYLFAITFKMGLNGIWISMGLEWVARSIIFYIRSRGTKWLTFKVISE
ncbi:MAG: MATE family efflux transporter [Oscillospiraceae bacterium]